MGSKMFSHLIAVALMAFACAGPEVQAQETGRRTPAAASSPAPAVGRVKYQTVKIDGLDIFYREVGSPVNPTVLLLHGFPTSWTSSRRR
jgi:hypothetical protein